MSAWSPRSGTRCFATTVAYCWRIARLSPLGKGLPAATTRHLFWSRESCSAGLPNRPNSSQFSRRRRFRLDSRLDFSPSGDVTQRLCPAFNAGASAKVGCSFWYQAAWRTAAAGPCAWRWASSVTSENSPSGTGVVRRIAASAYRRCVSRPRRLASEFALDPHGGFGTFGDSGAVRKRSTTLFPLPRRRSTAGHGYPAFRAESSACPADQRRVATTSR